MPGKFNKQVLKKDIIASLILNKGNISQAAFSLGLKRTTLRDWVLNDQELLTLRHNYVLIDKITEKAKNGTAEKAKKSKTVPLEMAKPDSNLKVSNKQKYVVTCAQNNTEIHKDFVESLLTYCRINNAQLIVIPIRYKNVTAYIQGEDYIAYWPPELNDYYLNDELNLNDNLVILGDLKIQATSIKPLSGIRTISKNKSAIIGHPQLALQMVPTPNNELPRQLLTTGSCSLKNYSTSKAGHQANFHHTFGATYVEVEDEIFFTRQLNATNDGSFYDLDKLYYKDQMTEGHRVSGLVCGDIHAHSLDDRVVNATWCAVDSIVEVCKPEHQYLHDALDFYSANHHHRDNPYIKYIKHMNGTNSVSEELYHLVNVHNILWSNPDTFYHYISSNHNDALTRWLKETDPRNDPENALIYYKLQVYMLESIESDNRIPNPLVYFFMNKISNYTKVFFHSRNEKVDLHGIDLSQHGDRGPNGTRGSISSFSQTGNKTVIGHSHTPGIEKGAYCVGTSSNLQLGYNSGYSSWLHTHCIIYPNGKRTLINIIDGKWKLK